MKKPKKTNQPLPDDSSKLKNIIRAYKSAATKVRKRHEKCLDYWFDRIDNLQNIISDLKQQNESLRQANEHAYNSGRIYELEKRQKQRLEEQKQAMQQRLENFDSNNYLVEKCKAVISSSVAKLLDPEYTQRNEIEYTYEEFVKLAFDPSTAEELAKHYQWILMQTKIVAWDRKHPIEESKFYIDSETGNSRGLVED